MAAFSPWPARSDGSATCDNGTLRTILRRASGAPVGGDEELTVATSDFLATGGDGAFAPVRLLRVTDAGDDGPLVRDAIADRLRERGGWLDAKQFFDPARPPFDIRRSSPGPLRHRLTGVSTIGLGCEGSNRLLKK